MNPVLVHNIKESNGKTIRENNLEVKHSIPLGTIVEIDCDYCEEHGLRLFVGLHSRDCDGTPLYSLTFNKSLVGKEFAIETLRTITCPVEKQIFIASMAKFMHGYSEEMLKVID
tara:strand:+ start:106 stop:447 length:342 start_codon:yes stop_codon:yes gene_type:complete